MGYNPCLPDARSTVARLTRLSLYFWQIFWYPSTMTCTKSAAHTLCISENVKMITMCWFTTGIHLTLSWKINVVGIPSHVSSSRLHHSGWFNILLSQKWEHLHIDVQSEKKIMGTIFMFFHRYFSPCTSGFLIQTPCLNWASVWNASPASESLICAAMAVME